MVLLCLAPSVFACEPIDGLAPLLKPGSVLLLGEIHGSAESPAFVSRAVCVGLEAGHSITVALEIPETEGARIRRYLSSSGDENARSAVLAGEFWTNPFQDGRRSQAMLDLIAHIGAWQRQGKAVRLVLLDANDSTSDGRGRDQVMADNLQSAYEAWPEDIFIALTGNLHSRIMLTAQDRSMGSLFARAEPSARVIALDVAYSDGTTWSCSSGDASSCGAHATRGSGDDHGVRIVMRSTGDGFQGVYNVGRLTASPPAARAR